MKKSIFRLKFALGEINIKRFRLLVLSFLIGIISCCFSHAQTLPVQCYKDDDCYSLLKYYPLLPGESRYCLLNECRNGVCVEIDISVKFPIMECWTEEGHKGVCEGKVCVVKKSCKNDFDCINVPSWESLSCVKSSLCKNKECVYNYLPAGEPCNEKDVVGYCSKGKCLSSQIMSCNSPEDCSMPYTLSEECTSVDCMQGECKYSYSPDNTSCMEVYAPVLTPEPGVCLQGRCVDKNSFEKESTQLASRSVARLISPGTYFGKLVNGSVDWYLVHLKPGQRIDAKVDMVRAKGDSYVNIELFNEKGKSLDKDDATFYKSKDYTHIESGKVWYECGSKKKDYLVYIKISTILDRQAEYKLELYRPMNLFDADSGRDAGETISDALEIELGYYPKNWLGHSINTDDYKDYYKVFVKADQKLKVDLRQESKYGVANIELIGDNPNPFGVYDYNAFFKYSSFEASDELLSIYAVPKTDQWVFFRASRNGGGKYSLDVYIEGDESCKHELNVYALRLLNLANDSVTGHGWFCLRKSCNKGNPFSGDCLYNIEHFRDNNVEGECCYGFWPFNEVSTSEGLTGWDSRNVIKLTKEQFDKVIKNTIDATNLEYDLYSTGSKKNCVTWVAHIINPILKEKKITPIGGWRPGQLIDWIEFNPLPSIDDGSYCGLKSPSQVIGLRNLHPSNLSPTAGKYSPYQKPSDRFSKEWLENEENLLEILRGGYRRAAYD